ARYVRGDGFMMERLAVFADLTFQHEETGCVGGPVIRSGTLDATPARILITTNRGGLPAELVPVRWGRRRYLVGKPELREFCAYSAVDRPAREPELPYFIRQEDLGKPGPSRSAPDVCRERR